MVLFQTVSACWNFANRLYIGNEENDLVLNIMRTLLRRNPAGREDLKNTDEGLEMLKKLGMEDMEQEVLVSPAVICMQNEYRWLDNEIVMQGRWNAAMESPTSMSTFIEEMRQAWERIGFVSLTVVSRIQCLFPDYIFDGEVYVSLARFLASLAAFNPPNEIISNGLWEFCWNFGIFVLQKGVIDRWVLSIINNVSMRLPDLLGSLVGIKEGNEVKLSQSGCAMYEIVAAILGNEDGDLQNAAIGILMRMTRYVPIQLNGDILRRIMSFVSSELAHPSVRRLFFCRLSDCITFWSQDLHYDDVQQDLNGLVEMMREDPCMDDTLEERWTCILIIFLLRSSTDE
jgi:hypothetical protein